MDTERRKRTRVPLQLTATITVLNEEIPVHTWDLSLRGMGCSPDPRLKAELPCSIRFVLDSGTQFTITGAVVRCSSTEAAVFFDTMDEEAFYHLKRLVQYNTEDPDIIDKELTE